jgi:hypothetical protein
VVRWLKQSTADTKPWLTLNSTSLPAARHLPYLHGYSSLFLVSEGLIERQPLLPSQQDRTDACQHHSSSRKDKAFMSQSPSSQAVLHQLLCGWNLGQGDQLEAKGSIQTQKSVSFKSCLCLQSIYTCCLSASHAFLFPKLH